MKVDFKIAKTQFFDRPVVDHLSRQAKRVLSRFGSYVRRSSRQSIKKARHKYKAELTEKERQIFKIRQRKWAEGRLKGPKPKRPLAPSEPGKPPRSNVKRTPLKLIYFLYDPREQSVIVGPVATASTKGEATEALEHGGRTTNDQGRRVQIEARPFMTPAFGKHLPDLARWKAT